MNVCRGGKEVKVMDELRALSTSNEQVGRWCYGIIPDPELCMECRQCELQRKLHEMADEDVIASYQ